MNLKPLLIAISGATLTLSASADTFVMKDGSRLEGRILSETSDTYRLEVFIGKSIKDEKTVSKSDVVEIVAEKLDEKEFEKLKGLVPAPDFTTADEYARRMGLLSKFISDHAKSAKKAEAESMLATLKAEAEVISGGGIKMGGKMVSGEEYRADLYDIDAKILEKRIRDAVSRGDIVGALRGISRMEEDFSSTNSRGAVDPLKMKLLRSYKEEIDGLVSTYNKRVAERDADLARMSRDARVTTEHAMKEELDLATARFQADQKNDIVWVTTHPFLLESLEKTQEEITNAIQESEEFKPKVDAGRVYRNILKFIEANDDEQKIRDVLDQGEQADIPERYIKNLKAAATDKGISFE
jgi:hypothetical protein